MEELNGDDTWKC